MLDDARFDDFFATMSSGPRSGERVMEQTITRVIERGIRFSQMRSDKAFCGPSRASFLTGLNTNNHQTASNEDLDYYPFFREGFRGTRPTGGTAYFAGPWERDLALRAGLASTPVSPLTGQGAVGGLTSNRRTSEVLRGNTEDDLQAFTGSLPTWLGNAGVTCALFGKYTNAYADGYTATAFNGIGYVEDTTTATITGTAGWSTSIAATRGNDPVIALTNRYVPPGWSYWRCLVGTLTGWGGGAQDHFNFRYLAWNGAHGSSGDGKEGTDIRSSRYSNPVSISRSGSTATVTFTAHGMAVGDEFAIDTTGDAAWEGTTLTVASVPSADTFTYTLTSLPAGTTAGVNSRCYPRRNYGEGRWQEEARLFIESRRDDEPWFVYYAPDNPHKAQAQGGADAPDNEVEKRYVDTVSANQATCFNALEGWLPDKSAQCTGTTGTTRIYNSARRSDGSGPFVASDVGRDVYDHAGGTVIPAGATVVAVDTSLPGNTGGWVDISANILFDAFGSLGWVTFGTEIIAVSELTAGRAQQWQRRQEMMASIDDTIAAFLDACEARGWTNVTVVLTNDNGWQQGEHNDVEVTDQWQAKIMAWEGSVRSILCVRRPGWAANTVSHIPCSHYDLAPTILDFFSTTTGLAGLANHHAHTKRDGVSIVRLLNDTATAFNRAVLIHNGEFDGVIYGSGAGEGIIVAARKYIRHYGVAGGRLFDVTNDGVSYPDYERTDLAPSSSAEVTALGLRLDALRVGRWTCATETQTFRSA